MLRNAPCGYRLTADRYADRYPDRYADVADELALHGVEARRTGEKGAYVPLRRTRRPLVLLLPDERATHRLTVGETRYPLLKR
ncbi:hypothetical protein [Streptomyces sp. NPDC048187]|uniref:hypothetical protein n=1 Tax=Streptomyces sp. NPDC048187 TaxID=3365509 RepID=UPI00371B7494